MNQQKISIVIPAFNEEGRIDFVLDVVKKVKNISEIIVVDDGSDDRTNEIARNKGVNVIKLPFNHGKFLAVKKGILQSSGDIIVVLDADLLNLKPRHIIKLINAVKNFKTVSVAQFIKGRFFTDHYGVKKHLSGQRAAYCSFWLEFFQEIENQGLTEEKLLKIGFALEYEMNRFIKTKNYKRVYVKWFGVSHVLKEEKMSSRGFVQRIRMYSEIMIDIFSRFF
jgi:glycosyltransferase involved in cell wall biosynthesis